MLGPRLVSSLPEAGNEENKELSNEAPKHSSHYSFHREDRLTRRKEIRSESPSFYPSFAQPQPPYQHIYSPGSPTIYQRCALMTIVDRPERILAHVPWSENWGDGLTTVGKKASRFKEVLDYAVEPCRKKWETDG